MTRHLVSEDVLSAFQTSMEPQHDLEQRASDESAISSQAQLDTGMGMHLRTRDLGPSDVQDNGWDIPNATADEL